jgi:hypothetical protein
MDGKGTKRSENFIVEDVTICDIIIISSRVNPQISVAIYLLTQSISFHTLPSHHPIFLPSII